MRGSPPLARFVHVSDLHWGRQHDPKFDLANARVEAFFAQIAALAASEPLDWLVVSGDLTTRGSVDEQELLAVKRRLDALGLPYDVIPGNHDLCPSPAQAANFPGVEEYEPVALDQTRFGRIFGERGLHFERHWADVAFLGLTLRADDPDSELPRLARRLAQPTSARARVVVGHYPSAPVRSGGPLARWGPGHIGAAAKSLEALLAQHAPGQTGAAPVIAYLFGHVHVLVGQARAGIWHVTPGAVAVGAPGFRIGEIYPDRLRLRFVPLAEAALAELGFWSSEHPERCIDADHPTYETYHGGTPQERTIAIAF